MYYSQLDLQKRTLGDSPCLCRERLAGSRWDVDKDLPLVASGSKDCMLTAPPGGKN